MAMNFLTTLMLLVFLVSCNEDATTVRASLAVNPCPENFSRVSQSYLLGTQSFCISRDLMALDAQARLTVRSGSRPALIVTQAQAQARCQSLGANYDLISVGEYQAAAREVELIDENWSSDQVGLGSLGLNRTSLKLLSGDMVDGMGDNIRNGILDAYVSWTKEALGTYSTAGYNLELKAGEFYSVASPIVLANAPYDDVAKWLAPRGDYAHIADIMSGNEAGLGHLYLNSGSGFLTRGPLNGATYYSEFSAYASAAWIGFHCTYHY